MTTPSLPLDTPVAEPIAPRRTSWFHNLRGLPVVPLVILLIVVGTGILAPLIQPHDPNKVDLLGSLKPPVGFGGSWSNPMGTDELGRDVLSRLMAGAQISLLVGIAVVLGAGTLGATLALLAGYFRGWVDIIISRVTDTFLAVPFLLVAISVVGAVGASTRNLILVLIFMTWAGYARVLRSEVLRVREADFVRLAKVAGCSPARIILRHILPNIVNPLIVLATLQLSAVIVIEASLSFLGLGVPAPQATWGGMLSNGKAYLGVQNSLTVFPGIAIAATCLSINLMGDWLRVRLDPRFRQL